MEIHKKGQSRELLAMTRELDSPGTALLAVTKRLDSLGQATSSEESLREHCIK